MNILEFLKRLFKKENNNANHLINISDSFVFPTREIFKDNPRMLHMIESYKGEYKKVLSDKKLLFSMDLTNNINEDIRMYSELITNIFTREEESKSAVETKVNMFYKVNKLNLYKEEISKLNLECTARLVALLEIFNERKIFMSKHKKDALLFAMNNLTNALVVFEAQRGAIQAEKEAFLNSYAMITLDDEKSYEQERKKFIKDKLKTLSRILPLFGKEISDDDLTDILMSERELEIYVFKNIKDKEDLIKQINKWYELIQDECNLEDFYKSDVIYDLERKALIYYCYGKNILDIEVLNKLYELKLKHLLNKQKNITNFIIYALEIESECYIKIVYKKINDIVSGKNQVIGQIFGSDSAAAIGYIVTELKEKNILSDFVSYIVSEVTRSVHYDAYQILTSPKISFLMSFDYPNGFIKKLNQTIVTRAYSTANIPIYFSLFLWKEKVPITSIYEMARLDSKDHQCMNEVDYQLYKLYMEHADYYKLPEGIVEIVGNVTSKEAHLANNIKEFTRARKLILPDSLLRFRGNLFSDESVRELELNDGLTQVSTTALHCAPLKTLTLPASLGSIDFTSEYPDCSKIIEDDFGNKYYELNNCAFAELETLTFQDYKNSRLLHNVSKFRKLLINTLYVSEDDKYGKVLKSTIKRIIFDSPLAADTMFVDLDHVVVNVENTNKSSFVKKSEVTTFIRRVENLLKAKLTPEKFLTKVLNMR